MVDRTDAGLEVVGPPQRWVVDCNWRLAADNFVGDAYHTLMTHRSMVELGMAPSDPEFAMYGEHVSCGGHGLGLIGAPPGVPLPPYLGLPEEIVEQVERRFTPTQLDVFRRTVFIHGGVFPNLSLLNVWIAKDHMSAPVPFFTLRVWHPVGPDKMELWSWFLVERDGPDWYKQESYESYVHTFGVAGTFEQDDAENWRSMTRVAKGSMAREHYLNFQMGRGVLERDPDWPGPGEAYPLDYSEANQRGFHSLWLKYMLGEAGDSSNGLAAGAPSGKAKQRKTPTEA
jgi:PAH dioxygenase large subunit